jgi:ribonuclease E
VKTEELALVGATATAVNVVVPSSGPAADAAPTSLLKAPANAGPEGEETENDVEGEEPRRRRRRGGRNRNRRDRETGELIESANGDNEGGRRSSFLAPAPEAEGLAAPVAVVATTAVVAVAAPVEAAADAAPAASWKWSKWWKWPRWQTSPGGRSCRTGRRRGRTGSPP